MVEVNLTVVVGIFVPVEVDVTARVAFKVVIVSEAEVIAGLVKVVKVPPAVIVVACEEDKNCVVAVRVDCNEVNVAVEGVVVMVVKEVDATDAGDDDKVGKVDMGVVAENVDVDIDDVVLAMTVVTGSTIGVVVIVSVVVEEVFAVVATVVLFVEVDAGFAVETARRSIFQNKVALD